MTPEPQVGDTVDITIKGARIGHRSDLGWLNFFVGGTPHRLLTACPGITVEVAEPASRVAGQLGDLAEKLTTLPVDNLPEVLQALSRVNAHLADFVESAPSHFPHVTKRAAEQIRNASGALELAVDAELNPDAA
jgi:hypothetical protein